MESWGIATVVETLPPPSALVVPSTRAGSSYRMVTNVPGGNNRPVAKETGSGPAGVSIRSFKKPTPEEAAHHFLWRIRRALPAAGMIGVFNRSQYEDVVITKVHDWIDDATWAERIQQINAFEQQVVEGGTSIIKCFLHISYAEQRKRLLARLDDETKLWKFNPGDIDERAYWSDYQSVYSAVIAKTSTERAPWYVIPGDSKWYRNWAIGQLLFETLDDMKLTYPEADFDIEGCRRRLQPPY